MSAADKGRPADEDQARGAFSAPRPPPVLRPARRRRRMVALALPMAIVLIVYATPYLLSTGTGRQAVVALLNRRTGQTVSLSELHLTWLGPCMARGVRLQDARGREALAAEEVTWGNGLLQAMRKPEAFEHASARSVTATVYLEAPASLPEAGGKADKPSRRLLERGGQGLQGLGEELARLAGQAEVSDGRVRLVRPDGESYVFVGIDGGVTMDGKGGLSGRVRFRPEGGGAVKAEFFLSGLTGGGNAAWSRLEGRFSVVTEGRLDLAPAARFAGQKKLRGKAAITADGELKSGQARVDLEAGLGELRWSSLSREAVRPLTLRVEAHVESGDGLQARMSLSGEAGQASAKLSYKQAGRDGAGNLRELLSRIASGKPAGLPDFVVELAGWVDLPALAEGAPALVRLLPEVDAASGTLTASGVELRGGDMPSARGQFVLDNVEAIRGDSRISPEPVELNLELFEQEQVGVNVGRLALSSGFGRLEGSGTAESLDVDLQLDLLRLREQLGTIFDLGRLPEGAVTGRMDLQALQPGRTRAAVKVNVTDFRYDSDRGVIDLPQAAIDCEGYLVTRGHRPVAAVIETAGIEVDRWLAAKVGGSYDLETAAFECKARSAGSDLAKIAALIGADWAKGLAGKLDVEASLTRQGKGAPVISAGKLTAGGLALNGKPLADGIAALAWWGLELAGDGKSLSIASALMESKPARLELSELRVTGWSLRGLSGRFDLDADAAECLTAARPFFNAGGDLPEVTGRLKWQCGCEPTDTGSRIKGQASLADLRIVEHDRPAGGPAGSPLGGGSAAEPPQAGPRGPKSIVVEHDLLAGWDARRVRLDQLKLVCDALRVEMAGDVGDIGGTWQLDLSGSYQGSWPELLALAEGFSPGLRGRVSLSGGSAAGSPPSGPAGKFHARGPAYQQGARPEFRGVTAATELGWRRAELLGVPLGAADFSVSLAGGVLEIPLVEVAAEAGGKLRLGGSVDFGGRQRSPIAMNGAAKGKAPSAGPPGDWSPEPTYVLPGRVMLLENLPVTSQVGHDLLSRFNPVFAELAGIEGRVSIETADLELPLGDELKTGGGAGAGRLELRGLRVRPGGILAELLATGPGPSGSDEAGGSAAGLGSPKSASSPPSGWTDLQAPGVDFVIGDGRIRCDRFELAVSEDFGLEFRGSVGFDDSLDLAVSVPVSARLLELLGVRGPAAEYARVLEGARVAIPIVGTRLRPRLDLATVDTGALAEQAAKLLLSEQASQMLEEIVGSQLPGDQPPGNELPGSQPPGSQAAGNELPGGQPAGDHPSGSQAPGNEPGRQVETRPAPPEQDVQPLLDSLFDLLTDPEQ